MVYNLGHRKDVSYVQNLYWNHSAKPPLALNIFDHISMINEVLYNKLNSTRILIGSSSTYDLYEDKDISDVIINNSCFIT